MSKLAVATEAVKETLVGTHEPEQLSAHSKARFIKHAVKDAESGDLFLGPDEFINAVAPKGEDFVSHHHRRQPRLLRGLDVCFPGFG